MWGRHAMNSPSIVFGISVGFLVGIACGSLLRKNRFKRAFVYFGLPTGGAGVVGGINELVKLSSIVSFDSAQLLMAYSATTAVTVAFVWWRLDVESARGTPPEEAEMTQEQWDKLTPRQRIIVRRRLHEKKSSREVANELNISVDQVDKEFMQALETV